MDIIIGAVEKSLSRAGLMHSSARLIAAVSGGADSVALLIALCEVRKRCPFELCACHVQHGLRGESSLEDERFTRRLCERFGVRLEVRNAVLEGDMHDAGAETRARDERLRIFDELMREMNADALLLAHHLNDQAETALMRLMRGAGAAGLRAMPERKPFSCGMAVRPLLTVKKQDIKSALVAMNQGWREDESNQDLCTPRNVLRLRVFPELETLYPDAQRHIANTSEALFTDEDCLSSLADELYERSVIDCAGVLALDAEALSAAHEALVRRAVRRLYTRGVVLAGLLPDERALSHADTVALAAFTRAKPGDTMNLTCGLMALKGKRYLHLMKQGGEPAAAAQWIPMGISSDAGRFETPLAALSLEPLSADDLPPKSADSVWIPMDMLKELELRPPMEGDAIRPFGAKGSKLLRRYLTDRKVDVPFRQALPVLAYGSRVMWIPGLCAAEELRADGDMRDCVKMRLVGAAGYA